MAAFRKIVVKGNCFLWKYGYDSDDCQCPSQIIIKDCDRKGKIVIRFRPNYIDHGYCPFNKGLSAQKDGEEVLINLNYPKFTAEMLTYILEYRLKDTGFDTTKEYDDGITLLSELGYFFDYHLSFMEQKKIDEHDSYRTI